MSSFSTWIRGRDYVAIDGGMPQQGGVDYTRIDAQLRAGRKSNEIYFRVSFSLFTLLALATIWSAFTGGSPGVAAVFGISTAAAVSRAMSAWREKDQFDTMLYLADRLDDTALNAVLQALLERYQNKR